ncbi:MAG TPA: PIN domain-containing protein [Chthoniobacterales bacterium]|jgi:hypothetical protein
MPASSPELLPSLNHVFVDFENVRQIDLAVLGLERTRVTLLVGANEKKLQVELVEQLFIHAASVQFVRLLSSGRNALDLTLAYYLGRAAATEPATHYHIVSKDKDFDPLQEYLQSQGIAIRRCDAFSDLPFLKSAPAKPKAAVTTTKSKKITPPSPKALPPPSVISAKAADLREHLRTHGKQRPRTRQKLERFVIAHLGQKLTPAQAGVRIAELERAGALTIDEKGRVAWKLS